MKTRFIVFSVLFLMGCLWIGGVQGQDLPTGRLAYVGTDHNVYTYDFATSTVQPLTTDASATRRYQWPTWANDGRLAYFCCDAQAADTFNMQGYISASGDEAGRLVYEGRAAPVIYASWAPAPCDASGACRDLALLVNDFMTSTLRVDLVRDLGDRETIETIGRGSPFYYTWSPDATQMVFHRYGNELAVYDVAAKKVSRKFDSVSPMTFQTPAWSPIDDRILSLIPGTEEDRSTLIVTTSGPQQTPLRENLSGLLSFLWSPDGRYVAFRQARDNQFGALFVVDAVTGDVVARSDIQDVIAFFWSPDSTQIAYITLDALSGQQASLISDTLIAQGGLELEWSVLRVDSGTNQRLSSFLPTEGMIYMLIYFDQFAPSHRIWSPDSRYLVYTEVGGSGAKLSVYDVKNRASIADIGNATFAVWSWR